ncbi:hypothetical protein ES332_A03G121700v1 [Gossypium tomentosum]|uniref:Uncharacterized protein n=1 Tax=Gossypium tomentosum TaxID=34277 RepID=A0A5D2R753_GOSTO|nr:hypothetical protein ES332_A03G121700v1 [Gossypium tomentosum]
MSYQYTDEHLDFSLLPRFSSSLSIFFYSKFCRATRCRRHSLPSYDASVAPVLLPSISPQPQVVVTLLRAVYQQPRRGNQVFRESRHFKFDNN